MQMIMTLIGLGFILVGDKFGELFISSKLFYPHGMCYRWNPELMGLHVSSDLVIAGSYYAIPFMLVRLAKERSDLMKGWVYAAFSAFILWCGTTHLMNVIVIWYPRYWIEGMVKMTTALISVFAAVAVGWFLRQFGNHMTHEQRCLERIRSGEEMLVRIDEWERLTRQTLGEK